MGAAAGACEAPSCWGLAADSWNPLYCWGLAADSCDALGCWGGPALSAATRMLPVAVVCMLSNFHNLAIEANSAFVLTARFLIQGVFLPVIVASESSAFR